MSDDVPEPHRGNMEGGSEDMITESEGAAAEPAASRKKAKGTNHVLIDDPRVHVGRYPTSEMRQWLNKVLKGIPADGGSGLMSE